MPHSLKTLIRRPQKSAFINCCSVAQSCPTLCNPIDCSTPGFPVLNCLLELAQTHVCWVGDAIQPSYPLSSPWPFVKTGQCVRVGSYNPVSKTPKNIYTVCRWATQLVVTVWRLKPQPATVFPWVTDNVLPSVYLLVTFPGKKSLFISSPRGLWNKTEHARFFRLLLSKFIEAFTTLVGPSAFPRSFFQFEFLKSFSPYSFCQ